MFFNGKMPSVQYKSSLSPWLFVICFSANIRMLVELVGRVLTGGVSTAGYSRERQSTETLLRKLIFCFEDTIIETQETLDYPTPNF